MPDGVPLWIIAGFLGSGKTTLLNRLLKEFAPQRVGVLVNDFGTLGVDRHLVSAGNAESSGSADGVVELNGGQIFCSCISGKFVDHLVEIARKPVGAIVVEASGMAKPGAMDAIQHEARSRCEDRFFYAGMLTVVDAPRFDRLRTVVNAVEEQVAYADCVVVNKCDRSDADTIAGVERTIAEINPNARIVRTVHGAFGLPDLPSGPLNRLEREEEVRARFRGWGGKKPVVRVWKPSEPVTVEALRSIVHEKARRALRIKGFVATTDGPVFVDGVADESRIESVDALPGETGLTEFYPVTAEDRDGSELGVASTVFAEGACDR